MKNKIQLKIWGLKGGVFRCINIISSFICHDPSHMMIYLAIALLKLVPWHYWHHYPTLQNRGPINQTEINVCEILEVSITPFTSKASYCSKGAPQKGKSELCSILMYVMTDIYGSLCFWAIFSASLLLTWVHCGAVSPVVVKTRGFDEVIFPLIDILTNLILEKFAMSVAVYAISHMACIITHKISHLGE